MIDGRDLQRTSTYRPRRTMTRIIAATLVALIAVTSAAVAQDYPNRPIKFMHGFPPGGNVDIIGRLLGNEMSKGLGQSIVIEPKPGVAGSLAAEAVARSEPDGYTLLVVPSAHPAHGALARNVNYKVVEDFEWISVASFYPFLICVRKDSRFQTLTQLIDEAHKNPGVLKYGSAGVGSILHTSVRRPHSVHKKISGRTTMNLKDCQICASSHASRREVLAGLEAVGAATLLTAAAARGQAER